MLALLAQKRGDLKLYEKAAEVSGNERNKVKFNGEARRISKLI